jgi:hypothetical protein
MDACGCCRAYIKKSWNLIDVEAGFELWRGGAGLTWHVFTHHRRCCPVGRKASRSAGVAQRAAERERAKSRPGAAVIGGTRH